VWTIAAWKINTPFILPMPFTVIVRLFELLQTVEFWRSVFFTLARIMLGFAIAVVGGIALAGLAYRVKAADVLFAPIIRVFRTAPVASYIILCLLIMPSSRLSFVISLIMGLPIVYTDTLAGFRSIPRDYLDINRVFGRNWGVFDVYLPLASANISAGVQTSLGLCWKAGVAAEVIGIPYGSIGEKLYQAKIFADVPSVLAWTLAIVLLSWGLEKVIKCLQFVS